MRHLELWWDFESSQQLTESSYQNGFNLAHTSPHSSSDIEYDNRETTWYHVHWNEFGAAQTDFYSDTNDDHDQLGHNLCNPLLPSTFALQPVDTFDWFTAPPYVWYMYSQLFISTLRSIAFCARLSLVIHSSLPVVSWDSCARISIIAIPVLTSIRTWVSLSAAKYQTASRFSFHYSVFAPGLS